MLNLKIESRIVMAPFTINLKLNVYRQYYM